MRKTNNQVCSYPSQTAQHWFILKKEEVIHFVDASNSQFYFSSESFVIRKIDVKCFPLPDALNPCEDVMGSQWLRTCSWIVVLLAVFGNIAVLLVLFSNW